MTYDLYDRRVFVAGHRGMVGRALLRRLERERCEVITLDKETVDLLDHAATGAFLKAKRPNVVLMAPRPGRIDTIYDVPFGDQRDQDLKHAPEFLRLKREILERIRETSGMKTDLEQLQRLSGLTAETV